MTEPSPEDESESEFDVELEHKLDEDAYDDGQNNPMKDTEKYVNDPEVVTCENSESDSEEAVG